MAEQAKSSSPLTWLADPIEDTREDAPRSYKMESGSRAWLAPLLVGVAFLVISGVGAAVDTHQFFFSYLVGWSFCLTISIGALFFLFFQHLTKATWSVVLRRINESLLWGFPLLAVLFIPIIFGMHDLYHWTHEELYIEGTPEYDEILAGKRAYLNQPFFFARMVAYFALWIYLSYRLYSLSVQQDVNPEPDTPAKLRKVSAWGLPLTAVATSFASYDILMSLDPHWFSTIFGVYFFAGGILAAISLMTLTSIVLQRNVGVLNGAITKEHYQDLGKYMFGFTVFWAYIAFSQYMLIWYAGIPEETVWYRHRLEHGWAWHSAALLMLHFVLPFFILLPRFTKRIIPLMAVMSVWIIGMHWFDIHWISMPVLHEHAGFHWLDFTCWLGLFGVYLGFLWYRFSRHSLVPHKDPYFSKSLKFENV